jgi:hypothetical protein
VKLEREAWCRQFVAFWSVMDPEGTTYAPMDTAEALYEDAGHLKPEDAALAYVELKRKAQEGD